VADCDAVFAQALRAGATPVTEIREMPWGDRVGRVRDPLGNLWWLMTRVEELDEEEIARRFQQPEYAEALQYVQSAEFFLTR
jgi:PhnB protein